jgi:hypothetical protein
MTMSSDLDAFQSQLRSIPEAEALLDEIAEEASLQEMTAGQRELATIALSLVAVAALWKLLSVGIGALRLMDHDARLRRRIDMIRELQELGYDRQAPFILERLQNTLLERPQDDPMMKALINIFGGD